VMEGAEKEEGAQDLSTSVNLVAGQDADLNAESTEKSEANSAEQNLDSAKQRLQQTDRRS